MAPAGDIYTSSLAILFLMSELESHIFDHDQSKTANPDDIFNSPGLLARALNNLGDVSDFNHISTIGITYDKILK